MNSNKTFGHPNLKFCLYYKLPSFPVYPKTPVDVGTRKAYPISNPAFIPVLIRFSEPTHSQQGLMCCRF